MSTKKVVLLGCGTVTAVAVILLAAVVGWVIHVSQDIKGIIVSIDSPLDVKVGETFQMTVNVTNERGEKTLSVSDIDLSNDYLNGFVIISTEPRPRSSRQVPLINCMSYTFDTTISAGETKAYIFTLRAQQAGIFRGDVDINEGQRFITTTAQTVVVE